MPPRRSSASPLKALRKSASGSRARRHPSKGDEADADEVNVPHLDDRGAIHSLAYKTTARDVPQIMQHVLDNMFEGIPEPSGLNSSRTAEVLNFRRNLPPLVTASHVHALSKAPTTAEREIAHLARSGVVRRLTVSGRGLGSTSIGDLLVLTKDWKELVLRSPRLSSDIKDKYIGAMSEDTTSSLVQSTHFTQPEAIELVQAGFLTSAHNFAPAPAGLARSSSASSSAPLLSTAGSRAPTGSVDAVGGASAVQDAGGGVGGARVPVMSGTQHLNFSLPSVGLYLKLLAAARAHFLALLSKSRPSEAPVDLLRERWDGGIQVEGKRRTGRGMSQAVLPGRTRKWKQFYGMRFQWLLEECFGTGAIELFETGAVGLAARIPG